MTRTNRVCLWPIQVAQRTRSKTETVSAPLCCDKNTKLKCNDGFYQTFAFCLSSATHCIYITYKEFQTNAVLQSGLKRKAMQAGDSASLMISNVNGLDSGRNAVVEFTNGSFFVHLGSHMWFPLWTCRESAMLDTSIIFVWNGVLLSPEDLQIPNESPCANKLLEMVGWRAI